MLIFPQNYSEVKKYLVPLSLVWNSIISLLKILTIPESGVWTKG